MKQLLREIIGRLKVEITWLQLHRQEYGTASLVKKVIVNFIKGLWKAFYFIYVAAMILLLGGIICLKPIVVPLLLVIIFVVVFVVPWIVDWIERNA